MAEPIENEENDENTAEDSFPTSLTALYIPAASQSYSSTLSSIKRATLSTRNRLQSIHQDSLFVQSIACDYGLPLVANERCGSWYIPPEKKAGSAYFKSTDGHWGQWAYSTRRLNLQVLGIVGSYGGCVIVDSTRRGKIMPDALSKTVPIWCTVINRLLFDELPEAHELQVPADVVGASERAQIRAQIDRFLQDAQSLRLNTLPLRSTLKKPMRPFWITPGSPSPIIPVDSEHFNVIVCCTASRRIKGAEASENGYIQGAGDDSEAWSHGLTPDLFWKYKDRLLEAVEEGLQGIINELSIFEGSASTHGSEAKRVVPTNLYLGSLANVQSTGKYDGMIVCSDCPAPYDTTNKESPDKPKHLHLHCSSGKLGSRALRTQLPLITPFISSLSHVGGPPKILIACSTSKDLSVGVALATLCLYFDDEGTFSSTPSINKVDKVLIRRRLAMITASKPDVNPSRTTLQTVNSFLMPRDK